MSSIKLFDNHQVMLKKDYEVYHYKQESPLNIDFHSHDFYEIYAFIDGNVTYYIEEKVFELLPGDVLVIPPGKLHKPVVSDGVSYERFVVWINAEYIKSLDNTTPSLLDNLKQMKRSNHLLIHLQNDHFQDVLQLLNSLNHFANNEHFKKDLFCKSYLTIYLAMLTELSLTQKQPEFISAGIVPQVIQYINAHLTDSLTAEGIAEQFFISKYYLNRLFKEHTNVTMYDYILSKRIIYAKSLIRHGYKVTDACFECGFKDYSNFYKTFVAKAGLTPKEFKNAKKQQKEKS